jgi:hypothetical protein
MRAVWFAPGSETLGAVRDEESEKGLSNVDSGMILGRVKST